MENTYCLLVIFIVIMNKKNRPQEKNIYARILW